MSHRLARLRGASIRFALSMLLALGATLSGLAQAQTATTTTFSISAGNPGIVGQPSTLSASVSPNYSWTSAGSKSVTAVYEGNPSCAATIVRGLWT